MSDILEKIQLEAFEKTVPQYTLKSNDAANAKMLIASIFVTIGMKNKLPHGNLFVGISQAKYLAKALLVRNCRELINGKIDTWISELATPSGESDADPSAPAILRVDNICLSISWFCQQNQLYWDDSQCTTYEAAQLERSDLGRELKQFNCFKSQQSTAQPAAAPTAQATSQPAAPANKQPAIGYKASGPHSKDIPNLIGNSGQKTQLSGEIYCIIADKGTGKNTPNAFITPLNVNKNGISPVPYKNAIKVHFSSGNGYTDCRCYFHDVQKALNFCSKCELRWRDSFKNIKVVKLSPDRNGYFQVETEFGPVFISAKTLNEELTAETNLQEAAEVPEEVYINSAKGFQITDPELYAEWSQASYS